MNAAFDSFSLTKNDLSILDKSPHVFQSSFWGEFKSRWGWSAQAFTLALKNKEYPILALSKPLALGQDFVYVPYGPWLSEAEPGILRPLASKMASLLGKKPFFVRFDLPWIAGKGDDHGQSLQSPGLRKAFIDVQPPSTVLLDLTQSEDELLLAMKSKCRYNIRLAAKKKIEIRKQEIDFLDKWYELYQETAKRDKIALHSFEYYRSLLLLGAENKPGFPEFRIFSAHHEDDFLAGIIVAIYKKSAIYLYGASSNHKRNLMPNHLIQWKAIQYAKSRGCESYDFYGIPPQADSSHPMYGLYRFKTGFGGEIIHRHGCYDVAIKAMPYFGFRKLETLRNFYFKVLKKRL